MTAEVFDHVLRTHVANLAEQLGWRVSLEIDVYGNLFHVRAGFLLPTGGYMASEVTCHASLSVNDVHSKAGDLIRTALDQVIGFEASAM